jgi:hypothetical protein
VTSPRARLARPVASLCFLCLLIACLFTASESLVIAPAIAASAPQKLKPTDHYALIFGTVWGPDDHPVYGVPVKIRRARDKKAKWEVTSDHVGEFAQRVPAGKTDYEVWADLKGVKTKSGERLHLVQKVAVHVEYDERVDIGLHLTR